MPHHSSSLADLGREVARLRKAKGLTQKELGALTGMGQSTLARFETGRVAEFGARKLLRLLEVLGHGLAVTAERPQFTDLLCRPGTEQPVAHALARYLRTRHWDELKLDGYQPGSVFEMLRAQLGDLVPSTSLHR